MRGWKVLGIMACLAMVTAFAADKNMLGIHDVSHVTFVAPVRVGNILLPAGQYVMRHSMEGKEHVMVFESAKSGKVVAKAKCNLVPLAEKSTQTRTVYQMNAANERVLQELQFRGDTAKHVFGE